MSHLQAPAAEDFAGIVFFDGVCNLCNALVNVAMRIDSHRRLRYASLQSPIAARMLDPSLVDPTRGFETFVFLKRGQPFVRSRGVFEVFAAVGGPWQVLALGRIIPTAWSDALYRWVFRNRYRLLGRRETCRLPTEAERALFLE